MLALPRALKGGSGRRNRSFQFALAHLHEGLPVQRLRNERGRLGRFGKRQHRGGVGTGAVQLSQRNEAFRAQIQEVEPEGRVQPGRGERSCEARWTGFEVSSGYGKLF